MKDINIAVNSEETKDVANGSGQAAHEVLLEALSSAEGHSMPTKSALELLYANDKRPLIDIKNSFSTVKTHCWTKADWRVEYLDPQRTTLGIVGKRVVGTNTYNPIK